MRALIDLAAYAGIAIDPWYAALAITGITADSRRVRPGYLFAALPGKHADGASYIADAVQLGAAAILARAGTPWPAKVARRPVIEAPEPRRTLALMAAAFAGVQPANLVAVTGTNGKTSTVDFLRQIWAMAGLRAASLGTLGLIAQGFPPGVGLTTPDPVSLAQSLADVARAQVQHVALEASSHGLDQHRLDGVRVTAAGFSNLTRDHLDYHGDIAAYRRAKLRLFRDLLPTRAPAVVNADMEPETLQSLRDIAQARGLRLLSVGEHGGFIRLLSATPQPGGQILALECDGRRQDVEVRLPGRFQADNVLLAAGLAQVSNVADPFRHLGELRGVRGRMELAALLPNQAAAYVDYAHTPDALARVLTSLRPHAKNIVCVFGAGGDRDVGKRPLMGEAVQKLADLAIITDDNPRSENPAAIRHAIRAACPQAHEIGDREAAIEAGLNALRPGDVLVVAGKGHEQGQIVGAATLPFDDASVIRRLAAGSK